MVQWLTKYKQLNKKTLLLFTIGLLIINEEEKNYLLPVPLIDDLHVAKDHPVLALF